VTSLLPVALALIMATLGLGLRVADFTRVAVAPRGVLIGLANLLVLSPLLAFAVAELYGLDPVFAVGLVLLGASPGGTMANLLTHLARGDTALSISMTALSSVCAAVTVPVYLALAVAHFDAPVADDVDATGVAAQVLAITVVPLALGMLVRARSPAWAARHERRAKRLAFCAFVVVVAGAVVGEFDAVTDHAAELGAAALTLNLAAMASSFAVSRLARLSLAQSTAVAIELGVHNSALAIAVGTLVADELTIPAAVYSAFMFATAGLFARLMHRRNAGAAGAAVAPLRV
jgi:BASS family bile acid:Na+ symporter